MAKLDNCLSLVFNKVDYKSTLFQLFGVRNEKRMGLINVYKKKNLT